MHLILDTESTIDIKRNMSTLDQESLVEKLDDVIQELKTDICNSNKENINNQDNIIVADDKDLNSEDDKGINEEVTEIKSPLPDTNGDNDISNNVNLVCEDLPKENPTQISDASDIVDDEIEKDEESDPIIINHENDKSQIEKKEDTVEKTNSHDTYDKENDSTDMEVVQEASVSENTNTVQENMNAVQEHANIVHESKNTVEENLYSVEDNICAVRENISTVQENLSTIQENTSTVQETTSTVQENSSTVQETTSTVQETTSTVQENISTVQENTSTFQKSTSTVPGNINEIKENIKAVQENINVVQENINAVQENIQENENISIANNYETPMNIVETVDLDAEEKESLSEKLLENCDQENESDVNILNDTLITAGKNKIFVEETQSIQLEKETTIEPMEIDINKKNGEICTTEELEQPTAEEENIATHINKIEENETSEDPNEHGVKDNDIEVQNNAISVVSENEQTIKSSECETKLETKENNKEKVNPESSDMLDVKAVEEQDENLKKNCENPPETQSQVTSNELKNIPPVLKLSNTLDILSDDDEIDPPKIESQITEAVSTTDKQCINIEDDDDIMLIDEDTDCKDDSDAKITTIPVETDLNVADVILDNQGIEKTLDIETNEQILKEDPVVEKTEESEEQSQIKEQNDINSAPETPKPLVPSNFLKSYKKNLADMTREDLEEFCILKIVESIVDRSNLSEIKAKLKTMAQNIDEYKKKAMMLTKQNRDLQVVLKSVQEEQKKMPDTPITPLKITRSVGMQVLMTEKPGMRRKGMPNQNPGNANNSNNKTMRSPNPTPRPVKVPPSPQAIPVPRLVPASNTVVKNSNITQNNANNSGKATSPLNGVKTTPPATKGAEKRTRNQTQSITVDLTDDEPPSKVLARNSPVTAPPVRVIPQNMLAPQRHPLAQNSPRKVYIPISGQQNQNIRPGQTIMLKTVAPQAQGPRPRAIAPSPNPRMTLNQVRISRVQNRHPAPLPEVKQYQTSHYKALPPAPDLKLSKVENGIVISWKIEGYQQDSYEEIASYQLYAYQETTSPPSTSLWKKIGDVKALPLPMACTLTQFMAGFKYYFAVRAVDIRSRYGPFSLPGSIILLNKI